MDKLYTSRKQVICVIFLLLVPLHQSLGQEISFRLYGYDACTKEVKMIKFFELEKGGEVYSQSDTSGILILSGGGRYFLKYALEKIDTTQLGKEYNIRSKEDYRDTLRLVSITPCLEPISHPRFIGFCCCNEKCDGKKIDYYANGKKRIEGVFREGIPIGKLFFYYSDGSLREVRKYSNKGKLVSKKLYNREGNPR